MAQLVVRLPGRHEVVGSNPCRCVTFLAENILVFNGRLIFRPHIFNGGGKSRSVMRFLQILPKIDSSLHSLFSTYTLSLT